MVLYTIKNLLPIKDTLKTVPSRGNINYIKFEKAAFYKKSSKETRQNGKR